MKHQNNYLKILTDKSIVNVARAYLTKTLGAKCKVNSIVTTNKIWKGEFEEISCIEIAFSTKNKNKSIVSYVIMAYPIGIWAVKRELGEDPEWLDYATWTSLEDTYPELIVKNGAQTSEISE